MSLPNYIVNIDELALVIGEALSSQSKAKKRHKYKGFKLDNKNSNVMEYLKSPILISSINFDVSPRRNIGYDNEINVYVDGELIMENVKIKEMRQSKPFKIPIPANEFIEIEFIIKDEREKTLSIDIGYFEKEQ